MPQNVVEKTFTDGSQTSKFTKGFSLESFPLYGNTFNWQKLMQKLAIYYTLTYSYS